MASCSAVFSSASASHGRSSIELGDAVTVDLAQKTEAIFRDGRPGCSLCEGKTAQVMFGMRFARPGEARTWTARSSRSASRLAKAALALECPMKTSRMLEFSTPSVADSVRCTSGRRHCRDHGMANAARSQLTDMFIFVVKNRPEIEDCRAPLEIVWRHHIVGRVIDDQGPEVFANMREPIAPQDLRFSTTTAFGRLVALSQ